MPEPWEDRMGRDLLGCVLGALGCFAVACVLATGLAQLIEALT